MNLGIDSIEESIMHTVMHNIGMSCCICFGDFWYLVRCLYLVFCYFFNDVNVFDFGIWGKCLHMGNLVLCLAFGTS